MVGRAAQEPRKQKGLREAQRWRCLPRSPSGREGSVINSDLGTEVCVRKSRRQPGGLSLSDCRQGHSLAPGQDEYVISSRCFPELEGGAHLLLLHPLPHSPTSAVGRGWSSCAQLRGWVRTVGSPAGAEVPRLAAWGLPSPSSGCELHRHHRQFRTSCRMEPPSPLGFPWGRRGTAPTKAEGSPGWRDLGQRWGKVTSEDHL